MVWMQEGVDHSSIRRNEPTDPAENPSSSSWSAQGTRSASRAARDERLGADVGENQCVKSS